MSRYSITIAILTAVLIALGANLGLSIRNTEDISRQFTVVCAEHRTLARIAKEEAQEAVQTNNRLIPGLVITGITKAQLRQSIEEKTINKARHVAELELIRRETC